MRSIANRYLGLLTLGVLQEILYVAIVRIGDLRSHLAPFLGCMMAAALFYLIAAWLTLRPAPAADLAAAGDARRELRLILLLAVVFRLTLLPLQPTLSGDLARAHWDGKIQAVGFNPYRYPPQNSLFAPIRTAADRALDHPGVAATAPPLAELLARWNFGFSAGLRREKLLYLAFDFFVIAVLLSELRRRGAPAQRILLYAWAPLGILEVAGNGHTQPVSIFFTLLALIWLARSPRASGMALIAAMATTFVAIAAAPAWFVRGRPRAWPWMALLLALFMLPFVFINKHFALPLLGNVAALLPGLRGLNAGWVAQAALVLVPARSPLPQLLPAVIAALAATAIWRRDVWISCAAAIAAALLFAPALPPSSALWVLPALVLFPRPAWLYFSVAVPLGYAVLALPGSRMAGALTGLEYLPLYLLLFWQWARSLRRPNRALASAARNP